MPGEGGASLEDDTKNNNECTMTQQLAREQGGMTRGGGMDMPADKRQCHKKGHEEEMEVANTMATIEEDAVGIGSVTARWEDKDNDTG
jgi:hypothetical protein